MNHRITTPDLGEFVFCDEHLPIRKDGWQFKCHTSTACDVCLHEGGDDNAN